LLERAATGGNPHALHFPRTRFPDSLDFSFSGLKTAALNQLNQLRQQAPAGQDPAAAIWAGAIRLPDFAASYQQAIVDYLTDHAIAAARSYGLRRLAVAGGVSANHCLRESLRQRAGEAPLDFLCPPLELCTDNAAMIAAAGYYAFGGGRRDALSLNAQPTLELA
jgi:N6-L-threonylcarbamoyladenine synthase